MSESDDDPTVHGQKRGVKRIKFQASSREIRSVYEEGVSLIQSRIGGLPNKKSDNTTDVAFSRGIFADLEEAIEFSVETLIYAGFCR